MRWQTVKLDELKSEERYSLVGGPFGSELTRRDYVDDGIPVIRGTNLPDDKRFLDEGFVFVSDQKADLLTANMAYPHDVVFTQRGTLGQVGLIPLDARYTRYVISQSQMKLTVNREKADPRFIYYFFRLPETIQKIQNHALTSGVPHINLGILKSFDVSLPAIPVQERIVSTLSAYDDLIENNRRRMALLENSARLLYREWFVHLRFPGHEHTRIIDGVPDGWAIQPLDDICKIGRGASPRPISAFLDGEIPWFKIGDGTASESMFIFDTEEKVTDDGARRSVLLDSQSLILSNSATCGIPFITGVRGCVHDGWLHFADVHRVSVWFLYFYFRFKQQELVSSVSDGSTQKNLNTAAAGRMRVGLPASDSLLRQFDAFAEPVFSNIFTLGKQNIALRAARDLLLPKLMSGELPV
jgi:type I restriction enzyme S subunit